MSFPGVAELLVVLVIVLVLLGPKRLPALGRQLGGGIREFKRSITRSDDRDHSSDDVDSVTAGRVQRGAPGHQETQAIEGDSVPERRSS